MDSQAHDALFRESFSQVETVQAYVKNCLPKAISELLDFETFELENGSFLDEELKRYFADVVWKCQLKIGLPLKLTLLFEHKSEYEELAVFQISRYANFIWDAQMRANERPSLLLPIVVYHGKAAWKVRTLRDYFANYPAVLLDYVPNSPFFLTDLRQMSAEQILELEGASLVHSFFLLNFARAKKGMLQQFEKLIIFVDKIKDPAARKRYFALAYHYLRKIQVYQKETLMELFKNVPMTLEQLGHTEADLFFREGKLEGKIERENEMILALFEDKISIERIAVWVKLSAKEVENRLRKMNLIS